MTKHLVSLATGAVAALFVGASLVAPAAYAKGTDLPEVAVNGPVGGAKYALRPTSIAVSADGNGFLSHLHWSQWGALTATGSGLQDSRTCWGSCDKWKEHSVKVELRTPISVHKMELFSKMTVSGRGIPSSTFTLVTSKKASW
jgi:hypothetical protein